MRYRYVEYSPQNKRQYFIACGVHELRAIDGALKASANATPIMKETLEVREALKTAQRGIKEALAEAERLVDSGKRRGILPRDDWGMSPKPEGQDVKNGNIEEVLPAALQAHAALHHEPQELLDEYIGSGLSQVAFNTNGQDFSSATIRELLKWRDKAVTNKLDELMLVDWYDPEKQIDASDLVCEEIKVHIEQIKKDAE